MQTNDQEVEEALYTIEAPHTIDTKKFNTNETKYEVIPTSSIEGKEDNNNNNTNNNASANCTKSWLSNQGLLRIACITFGLFVIAVIIGALLSGALSLLGDGAAMGVDVITYLASMYAEHIKARNHGFISHRDKWLFRVAIPGFALCALLAVTAWIASDAIAILKSPVPGEDDLDVSFLWGFASANMVIDAICNVAFTIRGRSVFYQEIEEALLSPETPHTVPTIGGLVRSNQGIEADRMRIGSINDVETELETDNDTSSVVSHKELNLNMLSAFTHISADTMRTIAIFVAAAVSSGAGIRADIVDAVAAIVVTVIIICICLPLGFEIFRAARQILNENSEPMVKGMMPISSQTHLSEETGM